MLINEAGGDVFTVNTDGGKVERQRRPEENFMARSVYCFDELTCYLAGYSYQNERKSNPRDGMAVLLKTVDGGKSWIKSDIATEEPFFDLIKFFDSAHGVLAARGSLFETTDGGNTWAEILRFKVSP